MYKLIAVPVFVVMFLYPVANTSIPLTADCEILPFGLLMPITPELVEEISKFPAPPAYPVSVAEPPSLMTGEVVKLPSVRLLHVIVLETTFPFVSYWQISVFALDAVAPSWLALTAKVELAEALKAAPVKPFPAVSTPVLIPKLFLKMVGFKISKPLAPRWRKLDALNTRAPPVAELLITLHRENHLSPPPAVRYYRLVGLPTLV